MPVENRFPQIITETERKNVLRSLGSRYCLIEESENAA